MGKHKWYMHRTDNAETGGSSPPLTTITVIEKGLMLRQDSKSRIFDKKENSNKITRNWNEFAFIS